MANVRKKIARVQELVWEKVIAPFPDLFRLECEYCWWWRGACVGSILTSLVFILAKMVGG